MAKYLLVTRGADETVETVAKTTATSFRQTLKTTVRFDDTPIRAGVLVAAEKFVAAEKADTRPGRAATPMSGRCRRTRPPRRRCIRSPLTSRPEPRPGRPAHRSVAARRPNASDG